MTLPGEDPAHPERPPIPPATPTEPPILPPAFATEQQVPHGREFTRAADNKPLTPEQQDNFDALLNVVDRAVRAAEALEVKAGMHGRDVAPNQREAPDRVAAAPQAAEPQRPQRDATGSRLMSALWNNPALIKYLAGAAVAYGVMVGVVPALDEPDMEQVIGLLTTLVIVALGLSARDSSYGPETYRRAISDNNPVSTHKKDVHE